jgi:hypothetical protein
MRAAVILVLGVLVALLLALAVGYTGPTSRHSRINMIVNNLRQLAGAAEQWAIDHHQTGAVLVTEADLTNYLRRPLEPVAGERYVLRPLPQSPEVVLTREVGGHAKGTVICFTTNGEVRFIPPNPQGGANGRQPIRSETNGTSAAAASRRSP